MRVRTSLHRAPRLLICLLVVGLVACSSQGSSGTSFAFQRPEHIEFVCFAPRAAPRQDEYIALPQPCCRLFDPSTNDLSDLPPTTAAAECTQVGNELVGTPTLHAVVTQSTRGEVAAVDLVSRRVLDSDKLVPGYTFLDTGGLPSAIVVPPTLPRAVRSDPTRNDIAAGPEWTYIASAEQMQVRAIPTCRFRSGTLCGPDQRNLAEAGGTVLKAGYDERTRVALPAAPHEMKLGPGPTGPNEALWVTLPELGLIARIDLAEVPIERVDAPQPDGSTRPADVAAPVDAFVLGAPSDPARPEATRRPKVPVYFRVPPAPDAQPLEPVAESSEYQAVCGLGFPYQPAKRKLPLAPRVDPTPDVWPTQLHFDAASGLLLVADRIAPVLHAFSVESDGALRTLGALPTGSPVREFVITPRVPAPAPHDLALIPAPREDDALNVKRYVYAIDDAGRLMVFDFVTAPAGQVAALPTLQPLLAPTPGILYRDRIELPIPVTSLEVIDTRNESDYVCGEDSAETLRNTLAARRAERAALAPTDLAAIAAKDLEVNKAEARLTIYDTAASNYLRGVFVVAAAINGTLSVIDVHDLDVNCRARKACCGNETCTASATDSLDVARDDQSQTAVAVRRHAVRRRNAGGTQGTVSVETQLTANDCSQPADPSEPSEPFVRLGTSPVCSPADPWTSLTQTWNVNYQGALPSTQAAGGAVRAFDGPLPADAPSGATDNLLEVLAPVDYHACSRGVEDGDIVAILGRPREDRRGSTCPDPTTDTAMLLQVRAAYDDRLLVAPDPGYVARSGQPADAVRRQVLDCYPDLAGIELRAGGYLVESSAGIYLHRVRPRDDGRCAVDEALDPLLDARLRPRVPDTGELVFKNPYVQFTMPAAAPMSLPEARELSAQVVRGSTGLQIAGVITGDSVADALPASLRYVPTVGGLFVLDTAGQGLRRYTLRPFQHDGQTFR